MPANPVLWDLDERGVATVTLNRPEVNNAYDAGLINGVQARLSTDELVRINSRSSVDKQSAAVIAKDWLTVQGLI